MGAVKVGTEAPQGPSCADVDRLPCRVLMDVLSQTTLIVEQLHETIALLRDVASELPNHGEHHDHRT